MEHDALANDLANSLRTERVMTWQNIQLGSSGSVRPDVYTINKSYMSPCPTAFECKVSRADFRSDVTSGKWQNYLLFASGVYFACEVGLFDKKEVPDHCGMIVRHPSGTWRRVKRAVLRPIVIPQEALIKLLIDGVEREGPRYRQRRWEESGTAKYAKKFGAVAARIATDLTWGERELETAKTRAEWTIKHAQEEAVRIKERANVSPERQELCELLAIKDDGNRYAIERAIRKFRQDIEEHPAIRAHRDMTTVLRRCLDSDGFKENA